jgi:hypothetical protein
MTESLSLRHNKLMFIFSGLQALKIHNVTRFVTMSSGLLKLRQLLQKKAAVANFAKTTF